MFVIMIVHNSTILSPILFQSNLCGCHLHFWRIYDSYMPTRQAFQDCRTNLDLHPIRVDLGQKRKQDIRICTLNLTKKARAKGEILRTHAHMRAKNARILPVSFLLPSPFHVPLVHS